MVVPRFVNECRLTEFEPGEVIFAQGEKGERSSSRGRRTPRCMCGGLSDADPS